MVDRILALINAKGLNPSQFADEIGVQRSAISHLISGRNNPSLDFVMKILKRYPDIDPGWLLNGAGEMALAHSAGGNIEEASALQEEIPLNYEVPEVPKPRRVRPEGGKEKRVEKIILIYNDNTFKELKPENS